jgi:SAM-dependent MidA family methyltransferase
MRSALYDRASGYYMSEREHFGRFGDFNTISGYHELFAQIMANEFATTFHDLARPSPFSIVELGPGNGTFALQVLTELRERFPEILEVTRYYCVEISPSLQQRQRALLRGFDQATWVDSLLEITSPVTGVFFANEFFDALPTHIVRQKGESLVEVYVASTTSGLYFEEGELSNDRLAEIWNRCGVMMTDGQLAEINIEAIDWLALIASRLSAGRIVTVDYGDLARELYTSARLAGTLRCFSQHALGDQPLTKPGEQDLTASVNFTSLIEYGRDFGLETISFEELPTFLMRNGILGRTASAICDDADDGRASVGRRLALKQLIVPHGIAAHFKILVQEKTGGQTTSEGTSEVRQR